MSGRMVAEKGGRREGGGRESEGAEERGGRGVRESLQLGHCLLPSFR